MASQFDCLLFTERLIEVSGSHTRAGASLIRKDGMAYRPWSLLLRPAGCGWAEGREAQHYMQLLIMIKDKGLWWEKYEKHPYSKSVFFPFHVLAPAWDQQSMRTDDRNAHL